MKILVGVKRVVDYNVRVQVKPDGSGVALDGVKMSVNPFDEIAVEEALRLREAGKATEVVVVSIGPVAAQEQLRTALAMGADRAILVESAEAVQSLTVARVFAKLVEKEQAGLVILGKQAIDDDAGQTPQMLAALLGCAQASYASKVEVNDNSMRVTQEVDAGLQTIEVDLPAVISADLRLNEPRYVKLPDIMKAKKKPMDTVSLADLGVEPAAALKVVKTEAPAARG
ncbi:MAG: electron transfer flavoprotein subunit beta/FixA family protein, partial [Candidatus Macondimonas sp.]